VCRKHLPFYTDRARVPAVTNDERLTWSEYSESIARSVYETVPHAEGRPSFDELDAATQERWIMAAEKIFDLCQP
jgi:hypothetical protein